MKYVSFTVCVNMPISNKMFFLSRIIRRQSFFFNVYKKKSFFLISIVKKEKKIVPQKYEKIRKIFFIVGGDLWKYKDKTKEKLFDIL